MLGDLSGVSKIYVITGRTDMRKSFDGLMAIIRNASEARLLTRQEFRWLMEGLSIDQPKAIKTSAKKKDF
jgi:transposase